MNNPFNISFGQVPKQYISRLVQTNEILDTFNSDNPSTSVFILTGIRGCGKTVMLTYISEQLEKEKDWLIIELNPEIDMLQSLAAALYSIPGLKDILIKAKLDMSALGLGISVENGITITDTDIAIRNMLENLAKMKCKLLITVDEISNNRFVKAFAASYQIYVRKKYPVFLLMTGLYDNIYSIQNEKSLTFLYRAPKIFPAPLNYTAVRASYKKVFGLSDKEAEEMAALTRGYSYAFQVLGYIMWERKPTSLQDIIAEYDQYLSEYIYEKIWSELSETDKKVLSAIANLQETDVTSIRNSLDMSTSEFSVYRDRLKKKGLIETLSYGHISLSLPRITEFIRDHDLR